MSTSDSPLQIVPVAERGKRRLSSISQALQAIGDGPARKSDLDLGLARGGHSIFVAWDRDTRERACCLARQIYQQHGYLQAEAPPHAPSTGEAPPETLVLLARNQAGRDVATLSVLFDGAQGLPCDEIYAQEMQELRRRGRRLAEFTRLALVEGLEDPKAVLQSLFFFGFIYTRRVRGFTDLVIEVNPRHLAYYRRMLVFEVAGPERPCPRVNGAPAVLLRMEFSKIEALHGAGHIAGRRPDGQRLHPYLEAEEEERIVEFFQRSQRRSSAGARSPLRTPPQAALARG